MKRKPLPSRVLFLILRLLISMIIVLFISGIGTVFGHADEQMSYTVRRVNVPELTGKPFAPAIFWFGKVDQTNNYADVRVWYYAESYIKIAIHIIDRQLWYDPVQDPFQLTHWDSVSIYLNLDGNSSPTPGTNSYLFELQLMGLYASYRGNGSALIPTSIPINASTEWRGANGPNSGLDSEGWVAYFEIPFSSLGLSNTPSQGTVWGYRVSLHDRDNLGGSIYQETYWPEVSDPNVPSSWGQLSFGAEKYNIPRALPIGIVPIRQGLNGNSVVDGEVGGHTTCGENGYNKWTEWGNKNYAGVTQFNIQNQWDISDWPCFSKFYITFPMSSVPPGYTIITASLTMSLFGTSGGGQWGDPPNSYIEVLTVGDDWNESTLTWNNAPLAVENISGTSVQPVIGDYHWDVSQAVDNAYNNGGPLRLVVYSIDSERHSGKYFYSSDSNDWNGEIRPTLRIEYGKLCASPGVTCDFIYLPVALKK